jgi:outer membrane lipoprotein carrier protein
MKQICLTLFIFTAINPFTFGQAQTAKNILDNVSTKLKSFTGVTANFSYTTTDHNGQKRGSVSGQIYIKGQKYYLSQSSVQIYCDGTKTWNYDAESQEVTTSDVSDADAKTLTPQKLLSDFYDKDFTYTLASSAGSFYEIDMIPTDKRKNFKQVNVYIDKNKNIITKAKVIDKSDNTISFTLTNIKTNVVISDSKFVFDMKAHPGVDVISQ